MSHEIEISAAGRASMAYVGEKPWHKLGVKLPPGCTVEDMINAANLNWTVSLERLKTASGKLVNRHAVIRDSDGAVLGDVGLRFHPLQNAEAFTWFTPFLESGLCSLESAGALFCGSRVWVAAKINQPADVIVPEADDTVERYMMLAHGHDGSLSIHCGLTGTRPVCNNTVSAALSQDGANMLSLRHTRGQKVALEAAQEAFSRADRQFSKDAEVFRALSKARATGEQVRDYVRAVFPAYKPKTAPVDALGLMEQIGTDDLRDELLAAGQAAETERRSRLAEEIVSLFEGGGAGSTLPGSAGTGWGAYNAVTNYLTHTRGRSADNRASNVWFGDIGVRALTEATEMFLK